MVYQGIEFRPRAITDVLNSAINRLRRKSSISRLELDCERAGRLSATIHILTGTRHVTSTDMPSDIPWATMRNRAGLFNHPVSKTGSHSTASNWRSVHYLSYQIYEQPMFHRVSVRSESVRNKAAGNDSGKFESR